MFPHRVQAVGILIRGIMVTLLFSSSVYTVNPIGRSIPVQPLPSRRVEWAHTEGFRRSRSSRSSERDVSAVEKTGRQAQIARRMQSGNLLAFERLSIIDVTVRAHEQAHMVLLGPYARAGPQYSYIILPDGRRFAVGGSVAVDLKPVPNNPEATIRKAKAVRRAAYAPMQPSSADMHIAAKAYRVEKQAKRELARMEAEEKAENEEARRLEEDEEQATGLGVVGDRAADGSTWIGPEDTSLGRFIDIYA